MNLHLDRDTFVDFIDSLNVRTKIAVDIIEKDYYVCLILKELAKEQDELKAYFKGGTAIYKMLDIMNRFSEDIDLTVKVLDTQSMTQNKKRLKKSALGYNVQGLELDNDVTDDRKGSITASYNYDSVFEIDSIPLQRAGIIKIESTSFTVSEPVERRNIEPIIYKFATAEEKKILEDNFGVSKFEIDVIKLERMFVDKIFAAEFYYLREDYTDAAKHIYDIIVLLRNEKIQNLLNNKEEFETLINYKRQEEKVRIGGVDENILLKDFTYLKCNFDSKFIDIFDRMQEKYVISSEYKVYLDKVTNKLKKLKEILERYGF